MSSILHAVVEERQFAQPLGQDVVVVLDVAEGLARGEEVDLGAAALGLAGDLERREPLRRRGTP